MNQANESLVGVFNPDPRRCGCLGAGWFDCAPAPEVNWVHCPYHSGPHPLNYPAQHEELCTRLHDEFFLKADAHSGPVEV